MAEYSEERWIVTMGFDDNDGRAMCSPSFRTRREAIASFGKKWAYWRKKGCRCVKARIVWSEP